MVAVVAVAVVASMFLRVAVVERQTSRHDVNEDSRWHANCLS